MKEQSAANASHNRAARERLEYMTDFDAAPVDAIVSPFYDRDGITIYNADCRDVLPMLGKFDLLLTDPPYELDAPAFDLMEPLCESMYCFGDIEVIAERWFRACGMANKRLLVWYYKNSPKPRGRWRQAMQGIIYGYNDDAPFDQDAVRVEYTEGAKKLNGRTRPSAGRLATAEKYDTSKGALPRSVIECPALLGHRSRERVGHRDQKPLELIDRLIRSAKAGSVIDPYMGSGTTLVACQRLGVPCIGIEVERKWCEAAVRRLAR